MLLAATQWASAWTVTEYSRTMHILGVHSGNNGFLLVTEGVNTNCVHQSLYFKTDTSEGRAMYALLLLAKATGQKLTVAYTPPASEAGMCNLEYVAFSPA